MHKSFILAVSHAAIDVNDVLTAVSLAPKYVRLFAMVVRSMVGTFAQLHPFGTKQYPARKKKENIIMTQEKMHLSSYSDCK